MRFLAIVALSVAVLTPALALADPSQPDAAATPVAPAATTATTGSAATTPAVQETVKVNPPADNQDEIVCKMGDPPIGTRLGASRECHTEREWAKIQKDSQDMLKQTQMIGHEGAMNAPGGSGK